MVVSNEGVWEGTLKVVDEMTAITCVRERGRVMEVGMRREGDQNRGEGGEGMGRCYRPSGTSVTSVRLSCLLCFITWHRWRNCSLHLSKRNGRGSTTVVEMP